MFSFLLGYILKKLNRFNSTLQSGPVVFSDLDQVIHQAQNQIDPVEQASKVDQAASWTDTDDASPEVVLLGVLRCAMAWQPEARIVGNVRAGDIARAISAILWGENTLEQQINNMVALIHDRHKNWWIDLETGEHKDRNTGELLMLCVSELAEAMEGDRKGLQDDHLPDEKMFDVELGDVVLRVFDLAGGKGVNLGRVVSRKLDYNAQRADHKIENRRKDGGKKY